MWWSPRTAPAGPPGGRGSHGACEPSGRAPGGGSGEEELLQGEQLCVPGHLVALSEKWAQLPGLSSQAGGCGVDAVGDVSVLCKLRREVHR